MSKIVSAGLLAAVTTLALAATASAAGTLDQAQETHDQLAVTVSDGQGHDRRAAQTFTAGLSGGLDQADLLLVRSECSPGPLTVEIRTVESGLPTDVVLATGSVSQDAVSSEESTWVAVVFTTPAEVTAGEMYALVARASAPEVCDQPPAGMQAGSYGWLGTIDDAYPRGSAMLTTSSEDTWTQEGSDFAFRTYVTVAATPTPTPAATTASPVSAAPSPTPARLSNTAADSGLGSPDGGLVPATLMVVLVIALTGTWGIGRTVRHTRR